MGTDAHGTVLLPEISIVGSKQDATGRSSQPGRWRSSAPTPRSGGSGFCPSASSPSASTPWAHPTPFAWHGRPGPCPGPSPECRPHRASCPLDVGHLRPPPAQRSQDCTLPPAPDRPPITAPFHTAAGSGGQAETSGAIPDPPFLHVPHPGVCLLDSRGMRPPLTAPCLLWSTSAASRPHSATSLALSYGRVGLTRGRQPEEQGQGACCRPFGAVILWAGDPGEGSRVLGTGRCTL